MNRKGFSLKIQGLANGKNLAAALLLCFFGAAVATLVGCGKTGATDKPYRVTFFDVGKGDCILVEMGTRKVLIDAGYEETASSIFGEMKKLGVSKLDGLVITHFDKDHVGGAAFFISKLKPEEVFLPNYEGKSKYYLAMLAALDEAGIMPARVTEKFSFAGDAGYDFKIAPGLVSYDAEKENDNDCSLICSFKYGEDSFLFMGDLEKKGIKEFLAETENGGIYAEMVPAGVLKMPHHGSAYKKTEELVATVSPKVAVITDSKEKPAEDETLEILAAAGVEVRRSSVDGDITIIGNGTGEVTPSRSP